MTLSTGMGKGRPKKQNFVSVPDPLKNHMDTSKSMKQSIIDAVSESDWIPKTNEPYLILALALANQIDSQPDRTDRIAEKLIAVLRALNNAESQVAGEDPVDALILELREHETQVATN